MRLGDLSRMLEATADAAFAVDLQGEILTWNGAAERLFGWNAATAVGSHCADLFDGKSATDMTVCRHDCRVLGCVKSGREVGNFDIQVNTDSGRRRWINVSILTVSDDRSGRRYAVHFARDIDKRKQADEMAKKMVRIAKSIVNDAADRDSSPPVARLSDREREILRLVAAGRTSAEIGEELAISPQTLRNHISNINQKLNTRNRLEAVLQADRNGLI